ncbi:MAG: hypothetical protein ACT4OJ_06760, partial [Bacteroidota bacterium]
GSYVFSVRTATLNQLKSSGSLRYFRNFDIIRLINEYDHAVQLQIDRDNTDLSTFERLLETRESVFYYHHHLMLDQLLSERPAAKDSILNIDLPLLNNSDQAISQMAYALFTRKTNLKRRESEYYRNPYNIAKQLIVALKDEYNLR